MNKEEILKIAKEKYPIGTLFKEPFEAQKYIMNDDLSNPDKNGWFFFNNSLVVYVKDENGKVINDRGVYLIYDGTWAETIPTPNKSYELW